MAGRRMSGATTLQFACRLLSCCALTVLGGCASFEARAGESSDVTGMLASAETSVAVVAGEYGPRLSTLSLRGATTWTNRADETLPAQVEVRGSAQPVTWRLGSPRQPR